MTYQPKINTILNNIGINTSNKLQLINSYYISNDFTPFSIPVDGDGKDSELRILSNITNTDQTDNIIFKLNNSPDYTRHTIRNDNYYSSQNVNHIYLTYQQTDNLFDYKLFLNSGAKRKIIGNIIASTVTGVDSYIWNNITDPVTSLNLSLRYSNSTYFEGYIKLYRVIEDAYFLSMVYNNTFNNNNVNINLDVVDCDMLEIIIEQDNNSGGLSATYNNDDGNNYHRGYIYNNDSTPSARTNITDNFMRLSTVYRCNNTCRISRLTRIAQRTESYVINGSERSLVDTVNYTNTDINSVQIFGNDFIGRIKVFKYY